MRDLPGAGAEYRVERWRLEELSVVPFGRDERAELRADEAPGEMVARMAAAGGDERRAAVARALRLDRWREGRPVAAGLRLAGRFGLDGGEAAVALDEEVRRHCDALERDLAA